MSAVMPLLARLAAEGIELRADAGRLRFRAPQGALTPGLLAEIKALEAPLLAYLGEEIPRVPAAAAGPLSDAQRRLWILHALDPASAAYHVPLVHELRGRLDVPALAAALQQLGERHEVLRTAFRLVAEVPQQVITEQAPRLAVIDVAQREDPAAAADAELGVLLQTPFDVAQAPLARAALIRVAPQQHLLVLVLHHLIVDGVSVAVLLEELSVLYAAHGAPTQPLPPVSLTCREHALWQQSRLERGAGAADQQYWLAQLAAPLPRLDLPLDFPRSPVASAAGAEHTRRLPAQLIARLRQRCREGGATLFMGLLAAVKMLLHRHTAARDIIVGTPTAGRSHPDLARVLGVFINTLVLRDRIEPDMSWRSVLAAVRQTAAGAFDHADYPFDRLVLDLQAPRDPARAPLFDVMVILQNQQTERFALAGLEVTPRYVHTGTSKYDLTFNFHEQDGAVALGIEYRTSLFTPRRIERLAAHLEILLDGALSEPQRPCGELPMLSADERHELQRAAQGPRVAQALRGTVLDLFAARAAAEPHAPAVSAHDGELSYRQLDERSTHLAHCLRACGVGVGSVVAVALERTTLLPLALLGVLKAGAAYTPLDAAYPAQRLRHQVLDSRAQVLLRTAALGGLPQLPLPVLELESCLATEPTPGTLPVVCAAAPAYVIYTSGSTGMPKGVQVSHRSLANLLLSMAQAPGLRASDVLLAVTTLSFDIAGLELYLPLVCGARLVIATQAQTRAGPQLGALLAASGATVMQATPATWRMLLACGWRGAATLRAWCGGEQLGAALAGELAACTCEVWNLYGPTETTIWSLAGRFVSGSASAHAGVPIGRPIANTTAWLLDAQGNPVPRGCPGDLYLGGDGVAIGYVGRPELTAARFVPDPFAAAGGARLYRTGDRAVLLEDDTLQFLGREDHQVKVRGFRIELGEVEAALARIAAVREAVVSVAVDAQGEALLVAHVVGREPHLDFTTLRAQLATLLTPQALPSHFVQLAQLPLTPNGKVDRQALSAPPARAAALPPVAPRDEWEHTVAAIWTAVLGIAELSVYDNFFELGGHSLRATRAVYLLQSALGVDVGLVDLFKWPTVAALAGHLRARRIAAAPPIAPLHTDAAAGAALLAPLSDEEAQLLGDVG